jgi:hypothetical protein
MGTLIAGPGRREKSRPPRRRVVPLERWSEGRWRRVEQLVGVRPADVPAFREAIRQAVAVYVRWTRDETPRPSGDELREEFEKLATAAGYLAERGLQLGCPDATRSVLPTALIFILIPEVLADRTGLVLEPHEVALLAERAREYAARWRHRSGPHEVVVDVALVQFLRHLTTIVERYGGIRVTLSWRVDLSEDPRAGEYRTPFFEFVRLLQPALPSVPGSIATCRPSTLGSRLMRARRQAKHLGHWRIRLPSDR